MNELAALTAKTERLKTQHTINSTLIAASLMLGLGVHESDIPRVISRLAFVTIPDSPAAVFDAVKLAILEDQEELPSHGAAIGTE